MDPFTVLNAAGNIAQFVEYSRNCYVQIQEIRSSTSGITRRNTDLMWSASELHDMVDNITDDMTGFEHASTPTEKRIREIGWKCQELAKDLREDIERKASKDRAHFITAFKSVAFGHWKPSEIDNKLSQLERLQDTLFKNLMVHMSNQQTGLRSAVMNLAEQNQHFGGTRADAITDLKHDLLTTFPSASSFESDASTRSATARLEGIRAFMESLDSRTKSLHKEQEIIQSLHFDDMPFRKDSIFDAWDSTFRWIYDKRLHFIDWLVADEGVYWISGHAGSGKSTLMKCLSTDDTIKAELLRWAGSKTLVKASFHFWFSGSELQKSQEGLLRSLLFEIFRQCPSTIRSACPERWQENLSRPWTVQELMTTLKRLKLQSPQTRFCFFVDGLDEYQDPACGAVRGEEGSAAYMSDIIEVMDTLSKLKDVKVCLSSRPWQAFEQAYGSCETRKLYVDKENAEDIRLYIRDKFEKSDVFVRTQLGSTATDMMGLVDEIVRDSKGVFLWVALVIESLLRGLTNQDRFSELQSRLAETPKTLNGVFERMLSSVEGRYQEEAAQILQVTLHAASPMRLLAYSHIGDHEHNALEAPVRSWSAEQCRALADATETRLKVRCPDLIVVRDCTKPGEPFDAQANIIVDWLHRTAEDFLSLEDTQSRLKRRLRGDFDPEPYIGEALLTQIKRATIVEESGQWSFDNLVDDVDEYETRTRLQSEFTELIYYAKKQELMSETPQKALLDELHSVMTLQGWTDSRTSFLGLMTAFDMRLYVKKFLPDALRSPGKTAPLLECALVRPERYHGALSLTGPPIRDMISLLLDHGADPNEGSSHDGITVWEHFLKEMYWCRPSRQGPKPTRNDKIHFAIIQNLLEHGANPHVRCLFETRKGDKSATMDLIEMLNDVYESDSVAHVQALILQKRECLEEEQETFADPESGSRQSGWGLTFGINPSLGWLRMPFFS